MFRKELSTLNVKIIPKLLISIVKSKKILLYSLLVITIMLILNVAFSWIGYWLKSFYKLPSTELSASLLGSISGGIIGGAGTIIAVFLSIQKTDEVQQRQKEELLYKERKDFANEIMNTVAKYSTNITKYYYDNRSYERYHNDLESWKQELKKDYTYTVKTNIRNNINSVEKKLDQLKVDRSIAIECYYLLNMKLYGNSLADNLLKHLRIIHNKIVFSKLRESDRFNDYIKQLNDVTVDFCKNIISQKE